MKWLTLLSIPLLLLLTSLPGCSQINQSSYTEKPVTFTGVGGAVLAGTLTLPAHSGPPAVPGLVLIAGSGPTDRDGNSGPVQTDLLKQIAQRLAQEGIASLRYDKRGVGGSVMSPADQANLADYVAWENFVGDAAAALHDLQQQPGIDARRTGFLGHSEGGLIALQAAQQTSITQPPTLLVLMSTPGRTYDVVISEQLVRILKLQGATAAQTDYFLSKNREIAAAIERTGVVPNDVPPGLAALYPSYIGKFYRSVQLADPAKLAARFSGPVLVLQGQKDVQVSAERDLPVLKAALSSRTRGEYQVSLIPNASHNLKTVTSEADPGLAGPVAPEALSALCGWLHTTWKMGVSQ